MRVYPAVTYLEHEMVIDIRLGDVRVKILTLDEPQKELIHNLDVRPGDFQDGLVLLRVERFSLRRYGRRDGSEQVFGEHFHHARIHGLGDDRAIVGDVIQELVERQSLDLLGFHVRGGVVEIENDVTLIDLLHEQLLAPVRGHFVEAREFLQLPLALVGNIKSRRMLALGGPNAFGHILGSGLEAIENVRLPWRRQVSWHRLGGAGRGDMLQNTKWFSTWAR